MLTLITGGARSGKSNFAQSLCAGAEKVTYIATAPAADDEMRRRIARHQQSRAAPWKTVEELLDVPEAVRAHAPGSSIVLIDCLTLWLSNLCFEYREEQPDLVESTVHQEAGRLIDASRLGTVIAVTNEVGSGIVPEWPVSRRFRDLQGFLNQQIAAAADFVYLLVSGISVRIKPPLQS